jgi:hypothetical protein
MSKKGTSELAAAVLLGLIMCAFSGPPAFAAARHHHRSVHAWIRPAPYYAWSPYYEAWSPYYGPPFWGLYAYDPGPFGHPAFVGGTHHRG